MIAITGAGGFIGSVILGYLNKQGITDIYCFDDLPTGDQYRNLIGKKFLGLHSTEEIVTDIKDFDCVIHFGANSSTLERDWASIYKTNVESTRRWHDLCAEHGKKFIFASSAAVYGNGHGPLNHYAFSKYVSEQEITNGVVLRLFNVYGPNEYHKGRMASTIYNWYNQLINELKIKIFYGSDQYLRDFIWVEDVARTVDYFVNNYQEGIYDLGTGKSRSFETVADRLIEIAATGEKEYISMPDDLINQYQVDTKADVEFLRAAGVDVDSFLTVEQGIELYYDYLSFNQRY
jgi:ADP-L-glycero-D-manno-heptose 6-epimerase